eukprot:CAMPEP_0114112752 /NCGR_PEP_ID=MMETSP0043_2-20121206/2548_1 /TAXON_ID=464988 /ORGANISM="Hemiselmis andersenii, Strain CCMP644" /LENGTH=246 /DNA_ID=CAMNT_0001204859 /DNA_START=479 /DNA_END=1221 /DNA_ORIENTATION=-
MGPAAPPVHVISEVNEMAPAAPLVDAMVDASAPASMFSDPPRMKWEPAAPQVKFSGAVLSFCNISLTLDARKMGLQPTSKPQLMLDELTSAMASFGSKEGGPNDRLGSKDGGPRRTQDGVANARLGSTPSGPGIKGGIQTQTARDPPNACLDGSGMEEKLRPRQAVLESNQGTTGTGTPPASALSVSYPMRQLAPGNETPEAKPSESGNSSRFVLDPAALSAAEQGRQSHLPSPITAHELSVPLLV